MKTNFVASVTLATILPLSGAQAQGEELFRKWDANNDGFLQRNEVPAGPREIFDRKDKNGDGKVSLQEHLSAPGPPSDKPTKKKGATRPSASPAFTIKQSWDQEPDGYEREVYVSEPQQKKKSTPVLIYFHGGGGNAAPAISRWNRSLPEFLIVAPQGYEKGWNIQGEKTKAPDVSFFKLLISELRKRYSYIDPNQISLVGSSNGAAYIYRLLIEVEEGLFQKAVPMVSSMLVSQHHGKSFWKSASETDTDELSEKATPQMKSVEMLYLHGNADKVVPFDGGKRFGEFEHHSAYDTALIWAKQFGYTGEEKKKGEAVEIGAGLQLFHYEDTEVTFIEVEDGNHGLNPHREAAQDLVISFLRGEPLVKK